MLDLHPETIYPLNRCTEDRRRGGRVRCDVDGPNFPDQHAIPDRNALERRRIIVQRDSADPEQSFRLRLFVNWLPDLISKMPKDDGDQTVAPFLHVWTISKHALAEHDHLAKQF